MSATESLRARLYAALRHEKSCTCGRCSGGLNAVDELIDLVRELEHVLALITVWVDDEEAAGLPIPVPVRAALVSAADTRQEQT